jgi:hypothetical protein
MPKLEFPSPSLRLSRSEARHFLPAQQRLLPPRQMRGKAGILDIVTACDFMDMIEGAQVIFI